MTLLAVTTCFTLSWLSSTVVDAGMSKADADFLEANSVGVGVETLSSGLQYEILQSNDENARHPQITTSTPVVIVHTVKLVDGTVVYGEDPVEATVVPSKMVPGVKEALVLMRPGEKWELVLQPNLAYGKAGSEDPPVPPDAVMICTIEMIRVAGRESSTPGASSSDTTEDDGSWGSMLNKPAMGGMLGDFFKVWHLLMMCAGFYIHKIHQAFFASGKSATASHILVETEDECNKIKESLVGVGKDELAEKFAAAAKEHSKCPSGKSNGGSLGSTSPGSMVAEFDAVLFPKEGDDQYPTGVVLGPVKTQFGYHVMLVEERIDISEDQGNVTLPDAKKRK